MKPLISVVSASWNQGRHAEACIMSVKPARRELVEHVIVDNCSDDETLDVLGRHPELITIVEPDSGQSDALNKGFRKARAEWILWLNVDDFLLPGVIDRYLEIIECEGDRLDLFYGHMVFVDEEGSKIKTVLQPQWRYWMTAFGGYVAPSTGSVFRKQHFLDHPLDKEFHMIMDTEWMLRAGKGLRVRRFNFESVSFRVGDNKTADHINHGELTPRHRKERELLVERYRGYPAPERLTTQNLQFLIEFLKRKSVRIWVLLDKARLKILRG